MGFPWRAFLIAAVASGALFGQTVGSGTSVVILRSPKVLVAAVDSKETYREYRDGKFTVEEKTACKVARVGPYYAIVAGVAHGSNGFDALAEAAAAWQAGDRLGDLAARAGESMPRLLVPLLESVRRSDPADFAGRYRGQAALQLTLIGFENGLPAVFIVEFVPDESRADKMTLVRRSSSCPGDCASPTTGYFLGTHARIDEFLKLDRSFISHPDERRVEALLSLEYADRPDIVGGPISMLRLAKAGSTILRDGACAR